MMKIVTVSELMRILAERRERLAGIEERVAGIIRQVRDNGEPALRELTKIYDGVEIVDFRVSAAEIKEAKEEFLNPDWRKRLGKIAGRIRTFAQKELPKNFKITQPEGTLERLYVPIEPLGVYVPAGTAPLVSTVMMAIVPAQTAGVKKIIVATPPGKERANKAVVATCAFLGVTEIYKIGGIQAITALAYGVGPIPKVAKIVGPGNEYVAAAKRLLYGVVDLDCPAGPSEVVVFADRTAPAAFISAELAGQAEHHGGLAILITPDRKIAEKAAAEIEADGFAVVSEREKAGGLIDAIAPEHLVVMASDAKNFAAKIRKAGAVFVGNYSPVALGDYLAGPSHILPTGGAAASFSGVSALTFLRSFSRISWNQKGLKKWAGEIEKLAELEGLPNHKKSVAARFPNDKH